MTTELEVRRHNGQCAYGEWLPIEHEDVPCHVRDAVLDEISERDLEDGTIEVGGMTWVWRWGN